MALVQPALFACKPIESKKFTIVGMPVEVLIWAQYKDMRAVDAIQMSIMSFFRALGVFAKYSIIRTKRMHLHPLR